MPKINYLEKSFVNPMAKNGLIHLLRCAFPSIALNSVEELNVKDAAPTIVAEEYLCKEFEKIPDSGNIILLVTECFLNNLYTGRITRNLNNKGFIALSSHVISYYLNLFLKFQVIGKFTKWDLIFLPVLPFILLVYLYDRFSGAATELRSLIEHEYMFANLQCRFDKILPSVSGLLFSHPAIETSFRNLYPDFNKLMISPLPVFDENFIFNVTGYDSKTIKWFGHKNKWREDRIKLLHNSVVTNPALVHDVSFQYNRTSSDSNEIFHLVMRQSACWPLSSPTKIYDILMCGKIPVLEYDFADHPICNLTISLEDLFIFYDARSDCSRCLSSFENILSLNISKYNTFARDYNKNNSDKLDVISN